MKTFRLIILTPNGKVSDSPVESAVAPGMSGLFGILPGHAPMRAGLAPGILHARAGGQTEYWVLTGGVAEVSPGSVHVLTGEAVKAADATDAEEKFERLRTAAPMM